MDFILPNWLHGFVRGLSARYGIYTKEEILDAFKQSGLHLHDQRPIHLGPFPDYRLTFEKRTP